MNSDEIVLLKVRGMTIHTYRKDAMTSEACSIFCSASNVYAQICNISNEAGAGCLNPSPPPLIVRRTEHELHKTS
jgi:predicted lipoprotein with Yx(FWY)xxD motif